MKTPRGYTEHHILHSRRPWESHEDTKKLRNNKWLKPLIDEGMHDLLHKETVPVPLLDHMLASHVVNRFEPIPNNYLKSVDQLLFSLESAKIHFNHSKIQRDLAGLVMMAVDLQRPYILEGIYNGTVTQS